MTREPQLPLKASRIEWPELKNHIPCMALVKPLAVGAFMGSFGGKCCTKSWEAHEHDQQFGEGANIDIAKSERLQKQGNARLNKVLAMRPGLPKIIEKFCLL